MFGKWVEQESVGRQVSPERESPMVPSDEGAVATNLSADTHFKGSLSFERTLKIEGAFEGEITTSGTLLVGKEAEVKAEIRAKDVYIEGKVVGNVTAEGKLHLKSTGTLQGDIKAGCLVVEEGAILAGRCDASSEEDHAKSKRNNGDLPEMRAYKVPVELNSSIS